MAAVAALCVGGTAFGAAQAQELKGSAVAGEQKTAQCIGCHGIVGFKTGFPNVHHVPKLHGQNASYIATALAEYKKGERKHPSMRAIAQTLSAQDMADLGAYFETHSGAPALPSAPEPSSADAAKAVLQKAGCPACHGANFNKPISAGYPKLAGQHPDYLYYALRAYQTQDKAFIGRANPVMVGMVKQLSDQDLHVVAQYLGDLSGDLTTVQLSRFR